MSTSYRQRRARPEPFQLQVERELIRFHARDYLANPRVVVYVYGMPGLTPNETRVYLHRCEVFVGLFPKEAR